jgi:hypothetical protein
LNTDFLFVGSNFTSSKGTGGALLVTGYDAGFRGGLGGAQITALFDTALSAGQDLQWVQVINTNDPLGGATSPYLDNAANTSLPFYSFTAENRDPALPATQLNFYDFPTRSPADLSSTDPITWNASLYPVITDGKTTLIAEDGVTWGWTMTRATVGEDSAVFFNPMPQPSAVLSGVGTNSFSWGSDDPSWLSFTGGDFDTTPGIPFDLGILTFHNGSIPTGTGADGIYFDVSIDFDNVPEKDFDLLTYFSIVNTLNTDDPIASADYVTIGDYGYTFNVLEGGTASVHLLGELSTDLTGSPAGTAGDSLFSSQPFDPNPHYRLTIVGLSDPSTNGFVSTTVPEPITVQLVVPICLLLLWFSRQRSTRG